VQVLDQVRLQELLAGEVQAEEPGKLRPRLRLPGLHLTAPLAEVPSPDGKDQARLLRQGDELRGKHEAPPRVLPADQAFEAREPVVRQGDDGLVMDAELLTLQGPPQLHLETEQRDRPL